MVEVEGLEEEEEEEMEVEEEMEEEEAEVAVEVVMARVGAGLLCLHFLGQRTWSLLKESLAWWRSHAQRLSLRSSLLRYDMLQFLRILAIFAAYSD